MDLIANLVRFNKKLYPSVGYAYTSIPTYPSGQIGMVLCSKAAGVDFAEPLRSVTADEVCAGAGPPLAVHKGTPKSAGMTASLALGRLALFCALPPVT
jgi:hypothetical protein